MVATAAVVGNLVGVQNNSLDVIFRDFDAQLFLNFGLVIIEHRLPICIGLGQSPRGSSGAIGPAHNTVRNVVPRVFAAEDSTFSIHFDAQIARAANREPVARGVRIGIARRALQEKSFAEFVCAVDFVTVTSVAVSTLPSAVVVTAVTVICPRSHRSLCRSRQW